jgi:hypothetical protein
MKQGNESNKQLDLDFGVKQTKKNINNDIKFAIGFSIYILIFGLSVPFYLYKYNHHTLLEAYMPNLDLIANILTWHGGPFDIWKYLYPDIPVTLYGFTSQTLINYASLLGITFLVARETKRTNSIPRGWSIAFVMLLATYLLPGRIISYVMETLYKFIQKYTASMSVLPYVLTLFLGSLFTISIIGAEYIFLNHYKKSLGNLAIKLTKNTKDILK